MTGDMNILTVTDKNVSTFFLKCFPAHKIMRGLQTQPLQPVINVCH